MSETTIILRALGQKEVLKPLLLRLRGFLNDHGIEILFMPPSAEGVEQLFKHFQAQFIFCFNPKLKGQGSDDLRFFYSQKYHEESLTVLASLLKELSRLEIDIPYRVACWWEHFLRRSYRKVLEMANLPGILIEIGRTALTSEQEEILIKSITAGILENFCPKKGLKVSTEPDTDESLSKTTQAKVEEQTELVAPEEDHLKRGPDPLAEKEQGGHTSQQEPQEPNPTDGNQTEADQGQGEHPIEPEQQQAPNKHQEDTEEVPAAPEQQGKQAPQPQTASILDSEQVIGQQAPKKRYYGANYNPLRPPGDAPVFKFKRPVLEGAPGCTVVTCGNGSSGVPVTIAQSTFHKSALGETALPKIISKIPTAQGVTAYKLQPDGYNLARSNAIKTESDFLAQFRSLPQALEDKIGKGNGEIKLD
ncbi:MAG: hypothetical protein PWP65_12 [Clostridia bacterium]|nr:hypothetical protein [Clostridia bacterium]